MAMPIDSGIGRLAFEFFLPAQLQDPALREMAGIGLDPFFGNPGKGPGHFHLRAICIPFGY
jgi:hypothetical protein